MSLMKMQLYILAGGSLAEKRIRYFIEQQYIVLLHIIEKDQNSIIMLSNTIKNNPICLKRPAEARLAKHM